MTQNESYGMQLAGRRSSCPIKSAWSLVFPPAVGIFRTLAIRVRALVSVHSEPSSILLFGVRT